MYRADTSEEAAALLSNVCHDNNIKSADSLLDLLLSEFCNSPPTPDEIKKWDAWNSSNNAGDANDYITTCLLSAHYFNASQKLADEPCEVVKH